MSNSSEFKLSSDEGVLVPSFDGLHAWWRGLKIGDQITSHKTLQGEFWITTNRIVFAAPNQILAKVFVNNLRIGEYLGGFFPALADYTLNPALVKWEVHHNDIESISIEKWLGIRTYFVINCNTQKGKITYEIMFKPLLKRQFITWAEKSGIKIN